MSYFTCAVLFLVLVLASALAYPRSDSVTSSSLHRSECDTNVETGLLSGDKNPTTQSSTTPKTVFTSTMQTCPACPIVTCPTVFSTTAYPTTTYKTADNVCKTSQCYTTASRILSLVDVTVDPCEDFYSYACGGLLNNPTLLKEDPAVDVWNRIKRAVKNVSPRSPEYEQKLKNYIDGCVNYDNLVTMEERRKQGRKVLDEIAKFDDGSSEMETDLTMLLIRLFQLGSAPLFDLQLDVHASMSSKFQLVVTIPDWMSSHFFTPEEKSQHCKPKDGIPLDLAEAFDIYENCMSNYTNFIETTQRALEFFQVFDSLNEFNSSQLIQEIRWSIEYDILELLKKFPQPRESQKVIQYKKYKIYSVKQLESELPQVSWSYLFSILLNVDINEDTYVQVYFVDYLKDFFSTLGKTKTRNMHNSLLAIFAHNLYTDLVLSHNSCDRESYCLRVAASLMPVVTSNLYLSTFDYATYLSLRNQVLGVYQQLETAMEKKLSEAMWLDEKTLNQIKHKLEFMSIQIPQTFNDSSLNANLGECALDKKHYFEDSVCLLRQYQTMLYSRYSQDPHFIEAMWPHFLTSFSTSPAFIFGLNTFMIPMAVMAPIYDKQMPRHVVMATLGNILARGIGHNFDYTGVKFGESNKIGMILSEDSYPTYEAVVDTFNMQFSFSKSHQEDGQIYSYTPDSELTLNERLSDITAANLSLSTIHDNNDTLLPWVPFSSKEVYFIALAQTFCSKKKMPEIFISLYEGTSLPAFERVINIAINSDQFALAFQCPTGSKMNPEYKTRPFPVFEKEEPFDIPVF